MTIPIRNHARIIMASNNDWVAPAGMEERRFLVMKVSDSRMQDTDYFKAVVDQMATGGRQALLHLLLNHDLGGFNVRKFPRTDALLEQKLRGMTPVQRYWYDCLCEGHLVALCSVTGSDNHREQAWPVSVSKEVLYSAFVSTSRHNGVHYLPQSSIFFKELKQLVPVLQETRKVLDSGGRIRVVILPELKECRRQFEERMGQPIDWET